MPLKLEPTKTMKDLAAEYSLEHCEEILRRDCRGVSVLFHISQGKRPVMRGTRLNKRRPD